MAQLIQMRQRIKAIETIKKITHAMRLIAMSTHSHLKGKEYAFNAYQSTINSILARLKNQVPGWHNQLVHPVAQHHPRQLIILVGSQKGMCGSFNSSLFTFFESLEKHHADYIVIGKKAADYLKHHGIGPIIHEYPQFTQSTLLSIAANVTHILTQEHAYTKVIVVSNKSKTFFMHKAQSTTIIPFLDHITSNTSVNEQYMWEQSPHELLDTLVWQALEATIQYLLFQSLLAENAARFVSMDLSTRNADRALDSTKLQYNKLRQAKITQELTELIGSF